MTNNNVIRNINACNKAGLTKVHIDLLPFKEDKNVYWKSTATIGKLHNDISSCHMGLDGGILFLV